MYSVNPILSCQSGIGTGCTLSTAFENGVVRIDGGVRVETITALKGSVAETGLLQGHKTVGTKKKREFGHFQHKKYRIF